MKNKLNIGCGKDIREDYVNLDIAKLPDVDVVCDIDNNPLPFDDNTFEKVVCNDVLEHVETAKVLREIHRVTKEGGTVEIRVPHFTSANNFIDPTHKKNFSFRTFNFFTKDSMHDRGYYYDFYFSEILSSKITFGNNLIYWIFKAFVNINNTTRKIYEDSFLRSLAPAVNIEVRLKK
jgi:ubiquinone/menaquinone biosynthesis C-methylase UbiE